MDHVLIALLSLFSMLVVPAPPPPDCQHWLDAIRAVEADLRDDPTDRVAPWVLSLLAEQYVRRCSGPPP